MEFAVTFTNPSNFIDEEKYKSTRCWIMDFSNQTRRPMNSYEIENVSVLPENANIDIKQQDKVVLFKSFALSEPETDESAEHESETAEEPAEPEAETEESTEPEAETEESTEPEAETEESTEPEAETEESTEPETEEPTEPEDEAEEPTKSTDSELKIEVTNCEIIEQIKKKYTGLVSKKKKLENIKMVLEESLEETEIELDSAIIAFEQKLHKINKDISTFKNEIFEIFD